MMLLGRFALAVVVSNHSPPLSPFSYGVNGPAATSSGMTYKTGPRGPNGQREMTTVYEMCDEKPHTRFTADAKSASC